MSTFRPFAALILSALVFAPACKKRGPGWRTETADKGPLTISVVATGQLQARVTVEISTQISGTVSRRFKDFNDPVRKGELLALIDDRPYRAAVADAGAALARGRAALADAERNLAHARELRAKGLNSQNDLDAALSARTGARAQVESASAALTRANLNLGYCEIRSPITGVVIDRTVDTGQTVAAALSAPKLFTIAEDLTRMQIAANVAEADIGRVATGQPVRFTVDAYPERKFTGVVRQVRLQPVTTQNVVNYTVIIDVENPERVLLPGMTASATLVIDEKPSVLRVPNAALRFAPPGKKPAPGTVWVLAAKGAKTPEARALKLGASDGNFTEVLEGLQGGELLVTGSALKQVPKSMLSGQPMGGRGRVAAATPRRSRPPSPISRGPRAPRQGTRRSPPERRSRRARGP